MSMLSFNELEELLVNRHLIIVAGTLTNKDQRILHDALIQYSQYHNYVGQAHIETMFYDSLSSGVSSMRKIDSPVSIMFFKNGLLVEKICGSGQLFNDANQIYRAILDKFDIILD